jgi:hypothetical protein
LSTVSNNVANANTEGYTRQRVTLQSTSPYPAVSKNSDLTAGQIGTGVKAGSALFETVLNAVCCALNARLAVSSPIKVDGIKNPPF